MTTETSACILCSRNCGLELTIEDNKITKIKGDEAHPLTGGYICQKAARLGHYQHHADRLTHPLKRNAQGEFEAVSWDEALSDIARQLTTIRDQHGGKAFATAGGGGQGNHLGGAYLAQVRAAMKSRYNYNSLGQEKTGDFWVNGRLFGHQTCHTTEDVEHADFALFIGCNPYQAHGIPNARDTLKHLKKDPNRTVVVIDPRRTETAEHADIHLQLKPGTDAFLMSAMLAIILRDNLHNRDFIAQHCTGFEAVESVLRAVPIEDYVQRADVPLELVERVARGFATARSASVRIDLGIQHTLNTTLNGYLEKLLYLLTGQFGKQGGNNLHTFLAPILGHTDERGKVVRTVHHQMFPIAGIMPPNLLPDEILLAGEHRIRAMVIDSCNPMLTWPDTPRLEQAFRSLDLLVVTDVALTETARLAHYVLPASSQFEKWEFTGFNLDFPVNGFHLRHPVVKPTGDTLPEPEIYTRLIERMGVFPKPNRLLALLGKTAGSTVGLMAYMAATMATLARNKHLMPYAVSLMYRTLGPNMPNGSAAAAPLLAMCMDYGKRHAKAVAAAGIKGNRLTLGINLFKAILRARSGLIISRHEYADVWTLLRTPDRKVHLHIPEMLEELQALPAQRTQTDPDYPFILAAGERRAYNANQIFRDPAWRKVDREGSMRIHPDDAMTLNLADKDTVQCSSRGGQIRAVVQLDASMRRGTVSLPHGYGIRSQGNPPLGPEVNQLTRSADCDPFSKTPFHKFVPVKLEKAPAHV